MKPIHISVYVDLVKVAKFVISEENLPYSALAPKPKPTIQVRIEQEDEDERQHAITDSTL